MKHQKGQMVVEMVLMLVLFVGVAAAVSSAFKQNQYFANLVSTPWRSLAGMIQNGVWGTPKDTMRLHPSADRRVNTVRGEDVR